VVVVVCVAIGAALPRFFVEQELIARGALLLFVGGVAFLIVVAGYLLPRRG
jgi:hypothetical protein